MMKISDLSKKDLAYRLSHQGIRFRTGPFVTHLQSGLSQIVAGISILYPDYEIYEEGGFSDFHVRLDVPKNLRRWVKPQVYFLFDGRRPFKPLPLNQALPVLEWGLNWCIANTAHQYLLIHAAVIEKNGLAVMMPAPPGSGKSTLCAGLASRGWRLLSDEMALVSKTDGNLVSIPRPIGLKDESIEVIRAFDQNATIGPISYETHKGTVAHVRPTRDSVSRYAEPAKPAWIIFPEYKAGADTKLELRPKGKTLIEIAENSFNYNVLGEEGFHMLARLMDRCDCYHFSYSSLEEAISVFDNLDPPGMRKTA